MRRGEFEMKLLSELARDWSVTAAVTLKKELGLDGIDCEVSVRYIFGDHRPVVAGVSGLHFYAPVIDNLLECGELYAFFEDIFAAGESVLIESRDSGEIGIIRGKAGKSRNVLTTFGQAGLIKAAVKDAAAWGGRLNDEGELIADLKSPQPGPNYYTNMLIGNRIAFERPLQSTPKSVVDRLGRGSFRSHADMQVLATRWDYRPEENGFPANRQFYLIENGRVIFYSADPLRSNIVKAQCIHSQNNTQILYETECGLAIKRTIFILPQEDDLPIATEVQTIEIKNCGGADRSLRLVYTGMFGTTSTDALKNDVIYTTVICQSHVLLNEDGKIAAVSYDYNPGWEKGNIRFNSLMLHEGEKNIYPDEFCFNYNEFVGDGTLETPHGAVRLTNRHTRRGPGFFALSAPFCINAGETVTADNFTGLVSSVVDPQFDSGTFTRQISALLDRFARAGDTANVLKGICGFAKEYASFLTVVHPHKAYECYVNKNLPFQVFYQTFVSRSFDQTQKGYREIGFREIQDIYASMYYFVAAGKTDFVKKLLKEWISNIHEMGYANHNFYWQGKEPGLYSDDALWLVQALDRYVTLTNDYKFLEESCPMAGGGERVIFNTVKALITYSAKISVGGHGLPMIDKADWNDCLRVDPEPLNGPEKERAYNQQIARSGKYGDPLVSEFSESVMNGFLLKCAADAARKMADALGDGSYAAVLDTLSTELREKLQKHCWKGDFFARVLFNRKNNQGLQYLGASGDGLAVEPDSDGTYYINSFSWAILSDTADERQIAVMLDTMNRHLKTPYGFRLCTGADYPKIAPRIDVALYFTGDRENGAIFKHANMMAAAAMLKAANTVSDRALASELARTAYWIIDIVMPYRTIESPFEICGNPRFCTQYNNSETGENIGPTLSGTSTWLLLSLILALGLNFTQGGIEFTPLIREGETTQTLILKTSGAVYDIKVTKPIGFYRAAEGCRVLLDGMPHAGSLIPLFIDGKTHRVEMKFE